MSTARDMKRLRRRCDALVRELQLPVPFDAWTLCDNVARQRGKPIHLLPVTGESRVLGMWVATDHADMIFYERATTRPHQEHIILHELSHLLCDHYPALASGIEYTRLLMPNLDPEMIRRMLGRTTYLAAEEQEAELLASLIQHRARQLAGVPHPDTGTDTLAGRVEAAFDCRQDDTDRRR